MGKSVAILFGVIVLSLFSFLTYITFDNLQFGDNPQTLSYSTNSIKNATSSARPVVLIYRDQDNPCNNCSESVSAVFQSDTKWHFDVRYVGSDESLSVSDGLKLPHVKVFVLPGEESNVDEIYKKFKNDIPSIQTFVKNGGRYFGFCEGGYFANNPGFGFGIISKKYNAKKDSLVQVKWRKEWRSMYFADGPYFLPKKGATVLATYKNGEIAAMVTDFGMGKVGVVGPHIEADQSWDTVANLTDPDGIEADLGFDLIDTVMK